MIKHSIQLLEWLGGVGSTKSQILADETQFDQDVRLSFDLSNAPGLPMGPGTYCHATFLQFFAIGEVPNVSFNGGKGGAMLRRFRVADSSVTSLGADSFLEFNNRNIGGRIPSIVAPNSGGRQFDDKRAVLVPGGSSRQIIPFSQVTLLTDPALAAVPSIRGEDRSANFNCSNGWHNSNIYIPPGDTGWSAVIAFVLTAPCTLIIDMEFELFPLDNTGMPK